MIRFVVNRYSGNGRGLRIWRQVERELGSQRIPYDVRFTERSGHAKELAVQLAALPETTAIVAVGGDGTVHEVANGILGSETAIGCIPAGSGDDFARGLGIPLQWRQALDQVLNGTRSAIDVASINERMFVISSGIGFDGEVARTTNRSWYKRVLNRLRIGGLSYVVTVLRLLATYRPCDVRIELDGRSLAFRDVWLIAIANMPYYGGGMKICPDARHDDGILNICLVEGISRFDLLKFFPRVFQGTHITHPSVRLLSGRRIRIEGTQPMTIHTDGEFGGETPAIIEVLPKRLHVLAEENGKRGLS